MRAREIITEHTQQLEENLHQWFKEKWVRFGPDGKIRGDCARGSDSEGKPKCLPQAKAHAIGKKGRASAAARKRREDPNPERHGAAINVATKKPVKESPESCPHCGGLLYEYGSLMEKKDACYYKVKASAKVWPSAYASGRLVQCRKKGAGNYGNKSESVAEAGGGQQAAIAIAKRESGKYSKKDGHRLREESVNEGVNPDCFNPAFNDTQHFDGLTYRATVEEEYGKPVLTIRVLDDNFQPAGVAKFKAGKTGVTSLITSFRPEYQGQGIARNIYAYVRAMGNTIIPSRNQLPPGRAMWDSWKKSGEAQHLMRDV